MTAVRLALIALIALAVALLAPQQAEADPAWTLDYRAEAPSLAISDLPMPMPIPTESITEDEKAKIKAGVITGIGAGLIAGGAGATAAGIRGFVLFGSGLGDIWLAQGIVGVSLGGAMIAVGLILLFKGLEEMKAVGLISSLDGDRRFERAHALRVRHGFVWGTPAAPARAVVTPEFLF